MDKKWYQILLDNDKIRFSRLEKILMILLFVWFGWLYGNIIRSSGDIPAHIYFIEQWAVGKQQLLAANGMAYMTYVLAFFKPENIKVAMFTLLALTTTLKFFVFLLIMKDFCIRFGAPEKVNSLWNTFFSFALLFIMALPIHLPYLFLKNFYLLSFPIQIFHSPTFVVSEPFAFLLYYISFLFITEKKWRFLFFCFLLAFLLQLTKPSFLFPWIVGFPMTVLFLEGIHFLKEKKIEKHQVYFILSSVLLSITVFLMIRIQEHLIFSGPGKIAFSLEMNPFYLHWFPFEKFCSQYHGFFAPKDIWEAYWLCWLPLNMLSTFVFPILVMGIAALRRKKIHFSWNDMTLLFFAWLLAMGGIIIALFFYETGGRKFHGNLTWQVPIVMSILFLASILILLKQHFQRNVPIPPASSFLRKVFGKIDFPFLLATAVLLIHLYFGGVYIYRILILHSCW